MAGGAFAAGKPEVRYAGEQLTARDIFCRETVRWKVKCLSRGVPGDKEGYERGAMQVARRDARRWPWLPRYRKWCKKHGTQLPPPDDASAIIIEAVADDGWEELIKTRPIEQPVPGRIALDGANTLFREGPTPANVFSVDTRLTFDATERGPDAPARNRRGRWYVVFVGAQVGVFSTE